MAQMLIFLRGGGGGGTCGEQRLRPPWGYPVDDDDLEGSNLSIGSSRLLFLPAEPTAERGVTASVGDVGVGEAFHDACAEIGAGFARSPTLLAVCAPRLMLRVPQGSEQPVPQDTPLVCASHVPV
eukprot:CAMPEP_0202092252 /NCGR_PEP_ID=MMETSP0964-20121228/47910_1 /ASSEMBLY_ACC=CAM_ASM_000500 /TAXON_ID=4773 /ORGANISM="Schizochytrium aggregatum, Strain ATCC28209" /LENGTH=124 /DNA_ID=CAMNT_0048660487 /DNA_START=107 /DNA_END=478 /DNA_ORIENTATION=-